MTRLRDARAEADQVRRRVNPRKRFGRAFWLRHIVRWHWISSALCLIGMLLFAFTGFTLNHAADIGGTPHVSRSGGTLPPPLRAMIAEGQPPDRQIPAPVGQWVRDTIGIATPGQAEWSAGEIYLSLPRPGGDAWLSIDRESGEVEYERTSRGWISYLNDLHKGRHTGAAWSLFLDVFAFACLVFCITGLVLLQLHSKTRPATWPVVGLGLVIPLVLALLFIHP